MSEAPNARVLATSEALVTQTSSPALDASLGVIGAPKLSEVPEQAVLEAWGISKRYPRAPAPVLDDVDLLINPGELVWIGGRNGVGKTTLLRILAGLILPDTGIVSFKDLNPDRDRREYQRRSCLLSAGDRGLYARLTVLQHLRYWAALCFIPHSERPAAVERTLEEFDLGELARRRVDRMSMGQRQRLRLAMAFIHQPELVLLDEPTNSLDAEGRECLVSAISTVLDRGGAGIVCSPTGDSVPVPCSAHYVLQNAKLTEVDA